MKTRILKALSILLCLALLLGTLPLSVFSEGGDANRAVNGYYDENGNWVKGGDGTITHVVNGSEIHLSKTATHIEGNTFEITLKVETSTTMTHTAVPAAVVLVIDQSNSMDYCAECGEETFHARSCSHSGTNWNFVTAGQSRMAAAKAAALQFLEAYAGTDEALNHQLAIATFSTGYATALNWVNVAGGAGKNGYDSAVTAINALSSDGGTNLEGGLYQAGTLLDADAVKDVTHTNVILLTDGVPTYRMGNNGGTAGSGNSGSAQNNAAAANRATQIKDKGADLYTVCFGVADDVTYTGGPTVGEFLAGSVASSADTAYNADNTEELMHAFASITEDITSGMTGSGWIADNPVNEGVDVIKDSLPPHFTSDDGSLFTWELKDPEIIVSGDGLTTTYIYTVTYQITFDPLFDGFEEGNYYPTNLPTYLNIGGEQYAFPVPGVNATLPRTSVSVSKVWSDTENQDGIRPKSVTVQLLANGEAYGDPVILNDSNNWAYTWTDMHVYSGASEITYTVVETDIPDDYTASYGGSNTALVVTNTHNVYKKDIEVTKIWDDNNNQDGIRPDSITVKLMADGVEVATATLSESNGWKATFGGLDVNKDGKAINYTIEEVAVDGYTTTYNGYIITNTHEVAKTSVPVTKVWNDANDQDGKRPNDVTVKLLADGIDTGKTLILSEGNNWTGVFADLDKFAAGTEIVYTIEEVAVDGYTTAITGNQADGYTITNAYTPEITVVSGSKTWVDNNNQDGKRPNAITINLLANGTVIDTISVTAEDGWAWTFTNLPKYENHGTLITYSITEAVVDGYTTEYDGFNVTNTHAPEKTSVTVSKAWNDANDQDGIRPNAITVKLLANGIDTGKTLVLSEGNNWTGAFADLDKYAAGSVIAYTIEEVAVEGYTTTITGNQADGYIITNTHTPETTVVSGNKTWVDNDDQDGARPDSITINLLKGGEVIDSVTVTAENGWAWTFTNLPKYENGGKLITYSISEVGVDGYTTTYDGFNVTNTHTPAKTSVTVTKSWQDNNDQDGIRPSDIIVKLLANGSETGETLILSAGNNWTGSFTDLDKYYAGQEIVYTVAEVAVDGYNTVITGDQATGFRITNSHTPATVEVTGTKTWKDHDNQDGVRPDSITINLLANGEVIDTITVTAENGWAWTFTNLPKYENGGNLITYTITETSVDGYTTEYDGFNVINTHNPEKTSVTVSKSWQDNNDQDGIRPNDITVKLLANGVDTGKTLVLSIGNNWTGSFTDLDKFAAGTEIVYTIEEVAVEGYTTVITGNQTSGFQITNSHTPETVDVSGSKTWNDKDDQDGKRPDSITINLLANGTVIDTISVTAENGWAWTFTNLPKYENGGNLITYSVTETAIDGYTTEYDGFNVTNTHVTEKTSVTVSKSWQDNNDQDGIRPDSVTVKLLAGGVDTGKTLVLNAANNWTAAFTDLDKYAAGEVITYTVAEITVDGYNTVINGNQTDGYQITNSHTPATIVVSGSKTWNDNNDQDGARPDSITINLLANGKVINFLTVTAENGWAWTFENLPKYENGGNLITYTITETTVDGYTTEYDGFNVTNTHAPEKTTVTVSKSWQDNNNQDGIRPASITVKLMANGVDTGKTLVLSADNSWTGSFTDLDKYATGEVIAYTVEEIVVEGYTTVITGNQIDGYQITNSHTPATIVVSGSKTWNDNDDQDGVRPNSITINLLANGTVVDTISVTAENNWAWTFENLPKYENGVEITYTITEAEVDGYTTAVDGFNVTNTHAPEKIGITVSKLWDDKDNQDGIRPDSITVHLLAGGEDTGLTLVLTAETEWTGTFENLDKFANGEEIVYTIAEDTVDGYEAVIDGFQITNTHVTETITIPVHKIWEDVNDQDGIRPGSVTIHLFANGEDTGLTLVLTAETEWIGAFENLDKYAAGEEIVYTITEDAVEGYEATIEGTVANGFTVTNAHDVAPKTNDSRHPQVWFMLMIVSGIGIVVSASRKRKYA